MSFTILILRINLHHNRRYQCPHMYITARNTKVLQQTSLLHVRIHVTFICVCSARLLRHRKLKCRNCHSQAADQYSATSLSLCLLMHHVAILQVQPLLNLPLQFAGIAELLVTLLGSVPHHVLIREMIRPATDGNQWGTDQ